MIQTQSGSNLTRVQLPKPNPSPQGQRFMLAVHNGSLQPGVPTRVAVMPQIQFSPERLLIFGWALDGTVHAIEAGGVSLLAGAQPASMFSPITTAMAVNLRGPSVSPGQEIALVVSRPGGGTFSGSFIGTATEPPPPEPLEEEAKKAVKEMAKKEKRRTRAKP